MIAEFAPAKINLSLKVTGKRADGYHLLDSLVAFAGVGDRLTFTPAKALSLSIGGPFAQGLAADETNLVVKAARACGAPPVHIALEKNLPLASGIGGGSADAAATLRGLSRMFGPVDGIERIALALGADVPVCLRGKTCRMRGVGEEIEDIAGFTPVHAALVNPGVGVSTRAVFARLVIAPSQEVAEGNDLEAPARSLAPEIGDVLDAIATSEGVTAARMSGSGATCFGLYPDARLAAAAARAIAAARPGWWVRSTVIGGVS